MRSWSVRSLALAATAAVLLGPLAAVADDAAHTEQVWQLCAQCHGEAGEGDYSVEAPAIANLPEWYVKSQLDKFRSGARGTHFDDITGMRMRPMSLSLYPIPGYDGESTGYDDVALISAYVANLPEVTPVPEITGGDPEKGKNFYALCASCHGPDGEGREAQFGPPLAGQSDWYLVLQMQKYKDGVRGTHPKDVEGAMMRPMALTIPDDQALRDLVAYIMTLPGGTE